jgi:NitT/TauT family transport system ATP-binding protein
MDEPFGALDPQIREMMQIELMKLWDQEGATPRKTVLFVTHSVDEAVFLSDRVIMLGTQPGRVITDLVIDLPRPRWADDEALKRSAAFISYRNDIWHLLKQQLAAADPV